MLPGRGWNLLGFPSSLAQRRDSSAFGGAMEELRAASGAAVDAAGGGAAAAAQLPGAAAACASEAASEEAERQQAAATTTCAAEWHLPSEPPLADRADSGELDGATAACSAERHLPGESPLALIRDQVGQGWAGWSSAALFYVLGVEAAMYAARWNLARVGPRYRGSLRPTASWVRTFHPPSSSWRNWRGTCVGAE